MSQYAELDRLILARMSVYLITTFGAMNANRPISAECERLADLTGARESFRVLDKRLQYLRKMGMIDFRKDLCGWVLEDGR